MSDLHTSRAKLLLNLLSYLTNYPEVRLDTLARNFNMNEKEMEKILLTELIVCGVPPYSPTDYITVYINDGPKGKTVSLQERDEFKQPIRLTSVEALAIKTAIEGYASSLPHETRSIAESLITKIASALGDDHDAITGPSFTSSSSTEHLSAILDDIDAAIAERNVIEIEYYSAEHHELRQRKVQPLSLFEEGSHFYLRAYCETRKAERTFRLDRIRYAEVLERTFTSRTTRKKVAATPGWDGTKAKGELVVRFEPFVADDVEEEWAPHKCKMQRDKDGALLLSLPLYSEAWALGWVLSFGQYAELLEPEYLREELLDRVYLMARTTGGDRSPR